MTVLPRSTSKQLVQRVRLVAGNILKLAPEVAIDDLVLGLQSLVKVTICFKILARITQRLVAQQLQNVSKQKHYLKVI